LTIVGSHHRPRQALGRRSRARRITPAARGLRASAGPPPSNKSADESIRRLLITVARSGSAISPRSLGRHPRHRSEVHSRARAPVHEAHHPPDARDDGRRLLSRHGHCRMSREPPAMVTRRDQISPQAGSAARRLYVGASAVGPKREARSGRWRVSRISAASADSTGMNELRRRRPERRQPGSRRAYR
jgi:hypothetical protein